MKDKIHLKSRWLSRLTAIMLILCLVFSLASCSLAESIGSKIAEVAGKGDLTGSFKRNVTDSGEVTDEFKKAYTDFSFQVFDELSQEDNTKNILFSPLSAYVCLALAVNGSEGETKEQLENVLGMKTEDLNPAVYAYAKDIVEYKEVKTSLANSVWIRDTKGLQVQDNYLQTLKNWYDVQAYKEAFNDSTVSKINDWCKKHTDGLIDHIMDPPIPSNEMLYLINALIFDGKWEEKYNNNEIQRDYFHNADGSKEKVSLLLSSEKTYLQDEDTIGFIRPYEGERMCFVGLLPRDEDADIFAYAKTLTPKKWKNLFEKRELSSVSVKIPEFKVNDKNSLVQSLKALSVEKMFSPSAEFLPMASCEGDSPYVSGINQFTCLELDREGTKASAVTGITMAEKSLEPEEKYEVFLDRPFVYMILDTVTGSPLFIGITQKL